MPRDPASLPFLSDLPPRWLRWLVALLCLSVLLPGVAAAGEEPLPPDAAFRVTAGAGAAGGVDVTISIHPGHYLYRERISAALEPEAAPGGAPALTVPRGTVKQDPNFGAVEILRGRIAIHVAFPPGGGDASAVRNLAVRYQGCADAGLCYPPQTRRFRLTDSGVEPAEAGLPRWVTGGAAPSIDARPAPVDASERVANALFDDSLPLTLAAFFGAGLLLALTPCMLPMVPILSGLIAGQGGSQPPAGDAHARASARRRAFVLSLAYVLAMAVTYAAAGVAAGLSGVLLSSLLQDPWVLSGLALIFVGLALSMLGVYDLQLPAALQGWATRISNRVPGGRVSGAASMGALSALIVGPCIAPPLAGALLFISRSGDVWLGGAALFMLALGMGVPLLVVGTSAGHLLARANTWYGRIRAVFGAMLIGVAVWITQPVWWPAWERYSGVAPSGPSFEVVDSLAQVQAVLRASGDRPVLLDFTADWCATCRQLERQTFADPVVAERLAGWRRLRYDVTRSTPGDREALAAFGLFGPPAVLLFDATGVEQRGLRVLNFLPPQAFLDRLDTFKAR